MSKLPNTFRLSFHELLLDQPLLLVLHYYVFVVAGSETHPQYVEPPVIPGHEFIGEVVKMGPGMSHRNLKLLAVFAQRTKIDT